MEPSTRRQLNRGFGDGFTNAVEIALVPAIFGGLGWLADRLLGTGPFLFIGLLTFGFVGITLKLWLRYDAAMAREEADKIWNRPRRTATTGITTPEGGVG